MTKGVAAGRRDDARPIICSVFSSLCPRRPASRAKSVLVMVDGHQPLPPPISLPLPHAERRTPPGLERGRGTVYPRRPTYKSLLVTGSRQEHPAVF